MQISRLNELILKNENEIKRMLDVDVRYQQNLMDAAIFGIRIKSKKISSSRLDILKIRMEEAMLRCQSAKKEILQGRLIGGAARPHKSRQDVEAH